MSERTDPYVTESVTEFSAQAAEEAALAHHGLGAYFARIETALGQGDLSRAARLLSDLIEQAREHFIQEESIAIGAGRSDAADRLSHDAVLERARHLRLMCKRAAADADPGAPVSGADLQRGLVLLLSDLVESDVRLQSRLGTRPPTANMP